MKIVRHESAPDAGLLIAGAIFAGTFIIGGVLFLAFLPWKAALAGAGISGVTSGVLLYIIWQSRVKPRLEKLSLIFEDISDKQFDDSTLEITRIRDDVDTLLVQASRTSEAVEREINRLKQVENYRKEFIGDVSHELKTPIFAIQGFLEALLSGALEDENLNRVFIRKAMRNVSRLIQLTNDLLEISKLESGELKSNPAPFPIGPLIQEVVDALQYKAETAEVNLLYEPETEPVTVWADKNQIRQVLNNIVDNAVKYNRAGGDVVIKTRIFPLDREKIEILVRDSGLGIDPKHIPRLTERFYRVDKSRSRERGGTGLGLSIVKHILEGHGEHLHITSVPNSGSTFSFTLRNHEFNR